MKSFDAIVIGAGSGLDIASAYTSAGKDVAVVEPGPLGGTCLNRGCIPSKMLIHHADVAETIRGSERFHVSSSINGVEFGEIVEEVNSRVAEDAENIEKAVKQSENHTLYRCEAEFIDDRTLQAGEEKITAEKIFIAAGTRPMVPPVNGLEDVDYLTSNEALELEQQPEKMVIIGGGYIACELAHFYRAMGTEITILEMEDRLLAREDREIAESFTELACERFNVELGMKASRVEKAGDSIRVVAEDGDGNTHSFGGDELLVAAGRIPNTDRLSLDATDIETDDRGFVQVDGSMETSVDGVYAIGDIAGKYMFKHSANYEARIATQASMGREVEADYNAMPHAVFSSPQIAGVGKTEQQLEEEDAHFHSSTYSYSDTGMGLALKEEDGFVKLLAGPDGEILGFHAMGPQASSIIHEVLVAKRNGLGVKGVKDTIHIHPALNEVVQRAFNSI